MEDAHRGLALAVAVLSGVLGLAAAWCWRRRGDTRRLVAGALIVEGVLVAQGLLGLLLVATGHRPASPLHWLYGVVLLVPVPAAAAYAHRPELRAPALAGGAVLLLLLVFRAFATG